MTPAQADQFLTEVEAAIQKSGLSEIEKVLLLLHRAREVLEDIGGSDSTARSLKPTIDRIERDIVGRY